MARLILLTWPDYVSPQTIAGFESEFGIHVELEIVPSAAELIERMRGSGASPDLLVPPDYAVRELHADGRLADLQRDRLPNLQHLQPRFLNGRAHDPESRVSVPKDWGTTGFMYRTDMLYEAPASWADFWRLTEKLSGNTSVLDSPGEVIGAALKMRGRSYNDSSTEGMGVARADLERLTRHLFAFETDYKPLLAAGEVCMALGWNGDAAALRAQEVPVRYVIPSEGSQIWEDDWAIAAGSAQPEAAHEFLNYVLRPEIAAQEARYTRYATPNGAALELLDGELKNDPSLYPPQDILEKLEPGLPQAPAAQRRRDELWQAIRSPSLNP